MELTVEHNLRPEELATTLVALAKSHGLEYEVHECLSKAVATGPKEASDPLIERLMADFRRQYADAVKWTIALIDKVVSEGVPAPSFTSKLMQAAFHKARPARQYPDGPLSKEEVKYIQDAIRSRFGYIAKTLESDFTPDDALLKNWKQLGIIAPNITAADFVSMTEAGKLVRNAFIFGRLHLAVEKGAVSFEDILKIALEAPLTKADTFAVEAAERSAAMYISKFGEDIATEAGRLINEKNRALAHQMIVSAQKQTLAATKMREGAPDRVVTEWRQLSSELYHAMEDKARDWERIGFYEFNQAQREGKAHELLSKHGPDQLVYKVPLTTACPQCLHLYLDQSLTPPVPRLFRLATMLGYGDNIGKKPMPVRGGKVASTERTDGVDTLKPVAGLVHPWCECTGPFPVTGYEHWYDQAAKPVDK